LELNPGPSQNRYDPSQIHTSVYLTLPFSAGMALG
jgi:hypothetical protein